jgi:hypothetical protein
MAQLRGSVPWPQMPILKKGMDHQEFSKRWKEFDDAEAKAWNDLNRKHKKDIVYFPVADGHAYYLIVSRKPLVLKHIPYLDGYAEHPAFIRGLRLQDIER